jgi:hypothetical protein
MKDGYSPRRTLNIADTSSSSHDRPSARHVLDREESVRQHGTDEVALPLHAARCPARPRRQRRVVRRRTVCRRRRGAISTSNSPADQLAAGPPARPPLRCAARSWASRSPRVPDRARPRPHDAISPSTIRRRPSPVLRATSGPARHRAPPDHRVGADRRRRTYRDRDQVPRHRCRLSSTSSSSSPPIRRRPATSAARDLDQPATAGADQLAADPRRQGRVASA